MASAGEERAMSFVLDTTKEGGKTTLRNVSCLVQCIHRQKTHLWREPFAFSLTHKPAHTTTATTTQNLFSRNNRIGQSHKLLRNQLGHQQRTFFHTTTLSAAALLIRCAKWFI
eukprot:m.1001396 g.1001396  ORF g.1001396 m.1001396 type:complete len:113 (-) comp24028_c0_seq46:497-835(-)